MLARVSHRFPGTLTTKILADRLGAYGEGAGQHAEDATIIRLLRTLGAWSLQSITVQSAPTKNGYENSQTEFSDRVSFQLRPKVQADLPIHYCTVHPLRYPSRPLLLLLYWRWVPYVRYALRSTPLQIQPYRGIRVPSTQSTAFDVPCLPMLVRCQKVADVIVGFLHLVATACFRLHHLSRDQ